MEDTKNDLFESGEFYYYLDTNNEFSWNDIINNESRIPFSFSKKPSLNFGHIERPIWIKVPYSVIDDSLTYIMKLGFPALSDVQLKYQNQNGMWESKSGGRIYPHEKWEFGNRNIIFSLNNLKPNGDIYLRIKTSSGLLVSLNVFTESYFNQYDAILLSFEFTFVGLLLGMAIYNFFLWILIKDRAYIFYTCYIISILFYITSMSGIAYQYLWPKYVTWNLYSISVVITSAAIFATLFTINFLDAKGRSKKLKITKYIIFSLWAIVSLLFIPLSFGKYLQYLTFTVIITALCLLSMGIIAVAKGYGPAKLYLFSWGIALSSISYYALLLLGFLPGQQFSHQIVKIGVGLESILLSIALANKVNRYQQGKERNFRHFKKQTIKLNQLKDEFLANTSHEIKTPLHGIVGITESILDGSLGSLSANIRENINLIHKSGKRLSLLVNDILDFTRLKHKDLKLNIQPVDLFQVSNHVIALLDISTNKSNLKLNNLIPFDLPFVLCDENRIQQILFNLLSNAIKFTNSGTIILSHELIGSKVKISIHDTGSGIEKKDIQKIFKRYEQLEIPDPHLYQGSGLGLTITKQLIELHSGFIEVVSEPGKGSTFSFTMPLVVTSENNENKSDSINNKHHTNIESFREVINKDYQSTTLCKQILIVDDEEINLHIVRNFLSTKNCQIELARNGREALDKCYSKKYDLVLLDVMMPIMSGYEVCRELRSVYNLTELPIILLTARNQSEDFAMGLASGANDFLSKPFDKSELFARIQNLLELNSATKDVIAKEIQLKEARYLANTDELTGLRNRRSFFNSAYPEWESSLIKSEPVCLLMLDIDEFKSLNDNYGHEIGDLFLKKVAEVLHFSAREKDIVGRYGGEEFIIFLPNTDFDTGILIAERIRKGIDKIEIIRENHPPIKRTLSIGISHNSGEIQTFEQLIKHADDLLYIAKRKGRNRIQFLSYV